MSKRPKIRLYVPGSYAPEHSLGLSDGQAHYLAHVMRVREGDNVAVFNGEDGEWLARVELVTKKSVTLRLENQLRVQNAGPDLWLAFAPIKGKTELVVEKAVELGASALHIVVTQHSVVRSINHEKLAAHAIEAVEQCERMDVVQLSEHKDLATFLANWPKDRVLLWADESGGGAPLAKCLQSGEKYGVLVGPEGGFSQDEQALLRTLPQVRGFGMGPRILRADTAAVAALACVQMITGDWQNAPSFSAKE